MPADISAERVSYLIGLIYDCVLEPQRWQTVVDELRTAIACPNCMLAVGDPRRAEALNLFSSGVDPYWLSKASEHTADAVECWGGPDKLLSFPVGEPIVASEVIGRTALHRTRYSKMWGEPQGLGDSVSMTLARDHDLAAYLAWGVALGSAGLSEQERSLLRLLSPHLRRAVLIGKLLEMQGLVADTLEAALDGLAAAVLLVGPDLDVVHANAAATEMLRISDPVRTSKGRLALATPQTTAALADAVQRAAGDGIDLGQRGLAIPARRRDGSPALVHVLPLRRSSRPGLAQRAVAAVFVAPASAPPQMPAAALALLYDLTPAETRVLELIVQGLAPAEIAKQLGVTLATTKTHLQRVFDKTGHSRQADLVRLIGSLTLPV